ncbi:probable protein phosphatase 2C 66 [Cynara cardunculus var. scolymus]|uniref:probable protein phosphatase 2C 66 n=1 Tax=Cynara cardunculus var. scolymus TaxID=59895 RepID=UPI000D62B7DA|nr:probable protein phosphatase 2C 66 [Cynara cardunculus var. scolymus]
MGTCYSTTGDGRRDRKDGGGDEDDETDRWWKSKSGRKINRKPIDLKFKFGGGGGRGRAAEERALHQVPGRLFGNGSSSIACLHTQQGKKGTNQDAMIVWEKFDSTNEAVFCGVFDGHGPYGHMVARKIRDSLPVLLSTHWKATSDSENGDANGSVHDDEEEDKWCEELEVEEKDRVPEKYLSLKKSILKAFRLMDTELKTHPSIDCFCSGSTAVALIKQAQDLIIGNLGDSRAVLATRDDENALVAVQLTVDLKPNLPREAARIQQFKGRVFALQDEPEVARVWLPNSDSPGLAMARAFGDFCLKDFGLISVPDVYYHHITDKDKFVVLATDGVWDVLSNKEAVDIVAAAPSRSTAARALVDCATRAWRLKYPTSKNDDCAAVCLFLDPKPVPGSQKMETKEPDIGIVPHEPATNPTVLEHSGTVRDSSEIVPFVEPPENKLPEKGVGGSKRSLAECITSNEDEEWSALDGVTRVNSLLSIPRFLTGEKRSNSSRKPVIKI